METWVLYSVLAVILAGVVIATAVRIARQ